MPSPFHGDRLKTLRTERVRSHADLADKVGSDARQVSRYENDRVAPSLDVLAKIADTLISVDHLILDPDALLQVLGALVTKAKLRAITG